MPKKAVSPWCRARREKRCPRQRESRQLLEKLFADASMMSSPAASESRYAIALLVIGMARFDDFRKANGAHDFTDRHNGR